MAKRKKPLFGFNDTPLTHRELSGAAKRAGANIGRFAVDWKNYDPATVRATARAMRQQGIRPLYALSGLDAVRGKPQLREFRRFARDFAGEHRGAIEIWNEPNSPVYGGMNARQYSRLLRAGVKGVQAADADRTVLSAGLAARPGAAQFQRRVLNRTENLDYDLGVHAYGQGQRAPRRTLRMYDRYDRMTDRPLWVTETGVASAGGAARQARQLRRIYRGLAKRDPRSIIVHRLRDDPNFFPGNAWEQSLGVLNADGTPKLAYGALSSLRGRRL